MVVDDEKFNLLIAKNIIEEIISNTQVHLCSDPGTVMEILATEVIDIVLLDIVMPKIDGISLLKQIRSRNEYRDMQIIMFTGMSDQKSFQACFENGANDYISKPIDITEFSARIKVAANERANTLTLKKTLQQLKDTQFYLLQKEKLASLGELAAGIAHEINNPAGFIRSNLETMLKYAESMRKTIQAYQKFGEAIDDQVVSYSDLSKMHQEILETLKQERISHILGDISPLLNESLDGIKRITSIVRSLSDFARSGSEGNTGYYDFNLIVEEALLMLSSEIKLVTRIEKKMGNLPTLFCEKGQITQVMINLLNNAIQAIKSQDRVMAGNILIETSFFEGNIVCHIHDNGPGIRKDIVNRVFDPFFTTQDVGKGAGLGLSIAYGIISKHGGRISVRSEVGTGTTFTVELPVAPSSFMAVS